MKWSNVATHIISVDRVKQAGELECLDLMISTKCSVSLSSCFKDAEPSFNNMSWKSLLSNREPIYREY